MVSAQWAWIILTYSLMTVLHYLLLLLLSCLGSANEAFTYCRPLDG